MKLKVLFSFSIGSTYVYMQSRKAALHGAAHPLSPKPSVPQFSIYQAKAAQKEYRQKYVAAYPQKRVKRLETLFVYKSFSRDNNKQVTGKGEKKHVK